MACDSDSNIDFGIFRQTDLCESNNRDIDCHCIERVIVAIKYIQSLNTKSNFNQQFVNFTQNVYPNMLNDKIHLIQYHGEQIQEIKQRMLHKYKLRICDVEKCHYIDRHQSYNERKTGNNQNKTNIDPMFLFLQNVFDSMHFYLYHLFDLGLRLSDNDNVDTDEKKDIGPCFDAKLLKRKRHILNLNRKYALKNADKFLIHSGDQSIVFLDDLLAFTLKYDVGTLRSYLMDEEYDSEAVRNDVGQYPDDAIATSNIYQEIKSMKFIALIRKYARNYNLKKMSFSSGFVFFYWPYYSHNQQTKDVIWANDNDYAGYSVADLYIAAPKFKDFQTEILNYYEFDGNFTMDTYKNQIILKAKQFMNTEQIKSMSANCHLSQKLILHYDIAANSPITIQHIMAVLIYCDYSELCTTFSATFRCEHPLEQLSEIKQRNKHFFFLSKYLREAVELYGTCRGYCDHDEQRENVLDNAGPFYCGMSVVMIMPSFSIRLNGPTSTTKQPQIAKIFAEHSGIIIQLNNKYDAGGYEQPFFNSSWLSNYSQEDERITMGGCFPIQIESIKHVATSTNFAPYFGPLFCFDAIISGLDIDFNWNKKQISILKSFIDHVTAPIASKKSKFEEYILDTFAYYLNNKQTLTFNLHLIDQYLPAQVKDLIFVSVKGERDRDNIVYVDNSSNVNIPRPEILNMFENMKKLVIYSTDERGKKTYPISIKYLLSQISTSNDVKYVIVAKWKDRKGKKEQRRSWLFYQDISASIPKHFMSSLTTFIDYVKTYNDLLTIQSPQ